MLLKPAGWGNGFRYDVLFLKMFRTRASSAGQKGRGLIEKKGRREREREGEEESSDEREMKKRRVVGREWLRPCGRKMDGQWMERS